MDNGKTRLIFGKKAQASLEMSAAFIVVLILLIAAVRLFAWLNASMVYRQSDYERTRVEAGNASLVGVNLTDQTSTEGVQTNESAYPQLNIFE